MTRQIRACARLCLLLALVGCRTGELPTSVATAVPTLTPSMVAATVAGAGGIAPPTPALAVAPTPTASRPPASAASPRATEARVATGAVAAPGDPFRAPYPPPASCAVAAWSARETRRTFPAYWLDGDGLAAGVPVGAVLYEGGQKIQWQAEPGGVRLIQVTGERLDGPAPPASAQATPLDVGIWSTPTTFSAPGCWRLRATDQLHTLDLVVYVYPTACRPPAMREPGQRGTPGPCAPPQ